VGVVTLVDLNLATRPFRNNTPLWVGYGLLTVALTAFTWWNIDAWIGARRALHELRSSLASVDAKAADVDKRRAQVDAAISSVDLKSLEARAERANEFVERRALSWTRLLNLLDKVQPYEVRLTSIRPTVSLFAESKRGQDAVPEGTVPVALEGVAQSLEAFLEFERDLIGDPHFQRVEPEKTDFVQGEEVVFGLRFLYDPEARVGPDGPVTLPHVLPAAAAAAEESNTESNAESDAEASNVEKSGGEESP